MTRFAAVAATAFVILAACTAGSATPTPTDPAAPGQPPSAGADPTGLDGRTFLSVALDGWTLVPGSQVRLSFAGGQLGASAGCNSMSGPYAVDGGRLVIGQLAMTEMGCVPAARMDQDTWLAGFLGGAAVSLDGDTLTLAKGRVTITLLDREVVDPDRPLVGTRWVVDGLVSGDAVSSVPAGVVATLVFAEGQVRVAAGCNSGAAPVRIDAATLAFGTLVLTEMACGPAATAVERVVTSTLSGSVGYRIEADVLTIDAGGTGLVLRATR